MNGWTDAERRRSSIGNTCRVRPRPAASSNRLRSPTPVTPPPCAVQSCSPLDDDPAAILISAEGLVNGGGAARWRGRTSWPVSRILSRTAYALRRRPSIWAHRRRVPQAAYPQIRASSPRTPARPHRSAAFLALLRVGFTKPSRSPVTLVRSYRTVSPLPPRGGGLFSVALSRESPRIAVSNHPAL